MEGDKECSDHKESLELELEIDSLVIPAVETIENESELGGPKFNPPLYRQRYAKVAGIIMDEGVTSVADIGCAECKALTYFRNIPCVTRLIGVDIDQSVLESHKNRLRPLTSDYLCRRENPLTMELLCGDISIADEKIVGIDAVTLIELIEHLDPPTLDKVPETLFEIVRPKLVVITTPNSEFNVLFPNFTGMRHWDHRFEWNREEFQTWCDSAATKHGYHVEFDGIGDPPEHSIHLGHCSQMAIFRRKEDSLQQGQVASLSESPYIEICSFKYPHATTGEKAVISDLEYYMRKFALQYTQGNDLSMDWCQENSENNANRTQDNCEERTNDHTNYNDVYLLKNTYKGGIHYANVAISLEHLLKFQKVKKHFDDSVSLRDFLVNANYEMTVNRNYVIYPLEVDQEGLEEEEEDREEGFMYRDAYSDEFLSPSSQDFNSSLTNNVEENWDESEEETFEPFQPIVKCARLTNLPVTDTGLAQCGQFSDCDEDIVDESNPETGITATGDSLINGQMTSLYSNSDINFFSPEYFMLKQQKGLCKEKRMFSTEAEQFLDDL